MDIEEMSKIDINQDSVKSISENVGNVAKTTIFMYLKRHVKNGKFIGRC